MNSLLENAIMCKVSGNAADRRRLPVKYKPKIKDEVFFLL